MEIKDLLATPGNELGKIYLPVYLIMELFIFNGTNIIAFLQLHRSFAYERKMAEILYTNKT